jgi:secreted trypsin-like serine protease
VATFYSVLAGTNVLSQGGERSHVVRYRIHPSYDPENNYENDIAVVEVSALPSVPGECMMYAYCLFSPPHILPYFLVL